MIEVGRALNDRLLDGLDSAEIEAADRVLSALGSRLRTLLTAG
jgi:hypothetical protein